MTTANTHATSDFKGRNLCKLLLPFTITLLLLGCRNRDYKSDKIFSPTGKYFLIAKVNRADKSKDDFADVVIETYSSNNQLRKVFNTNAGDANKWAVGWHTLNDTIILFSSDIGVYSWEIEDNELKSVQLTDELKQRANDLKQEKYK